MHPSSRILRASPRGAAAALVLAAVMSLPLPALAADMLQDNASDAQVVLMDGVPGQSEPTGHWPEADLRALTVDEDDQSILITLTTAGLPGANSDATSLPEYRIFFMDGTRHYTIQVYFFGSEIWAYLIEGDGIQGRYATDVPVERVDDGASLRFAVDRTDLLDGDGTPILQGQTLTFTGVYGKGMTVIGGSFINGGSDDHGMVRVEDSMPDGLDATATYVVQTGNKATGNLVVTSPRPYRLSNGEATTYGFDLLIENRGDTGGIHTLSVTQAPKDWQVTFPSDAIDVQAGKISGTTVLVATPFQHTHGAVETVLVHVEGPEGSADVQLAVRYTAIPQPGGHHPDLFLHTSGAPDVGKFILPTMNTELKDDADTGDEVAGIDACTGSGQSSVLWIAALAPPLGIGIDVDLNGTGTFSGVLHPSVPLVNAKLSGMVFALAPLGSFDAVDLGTVQPNTDVPLELTFKPAPEGDYVPYEGDGNMFLVLQLDYLGVDSVPGLCFGSPTHAATLRPGATMHLPLNDFHERIEAIETAAWAFDEKQRTVAPGSSVLVHATFTPTSDGDYTLQLAGANTAWARLAGPAIVHATNGTPVKIDVAVQVPADASDLDRADLVLAAKQASAGAPASLGRFVIAVSPAAEKVSDSLPPVKEAGAKSSPLGAAGLVAVLAAALLARRRRA